ncbi:hypothetical protein [Hymenobacter sedentarius]|nr:hypothetical protein [Hymenobacter sedentarius]
MKPERMPIGPLVLLGSLLLAAAAQAQGKSALRNFLAADTSRLR